MLECPILGGKWTSQLAARCPLMTEIDALLNSCAGNVAKHIVSRIAQKNNNMASGISAIPFQLVGRDDNASANRNMRAPQRYVGPGIGNNRDYLAILYFHAIRPISISLATA